MDDLEKQLVELAKHLSVQRRNHPDELGHAATELKALELLHKIKCSKVKIKGQKENGAGRLEQLLNGEIELE